MSTNLKIAKEKIINAGFRLEGDEEILIEEIRSNPNFYVRGKILSYQYQQH
jgi:hypothetical protein